MPTPTALVPQPEPRLPAAPPLPLAGGGVPGLAGTALFGTGSTPVPTLVERLAPTAVAARRSMRDKDRLFTELAVLVADAAPSVSAAEVEHELRERESVFTTAMGHGIAIPHATIPGLPRTFMGVMTLTTPIDFGQDADGPVDVCFCLVGPPCDRSAHLHLLAQIAGAVTESDLLERMRAASTTGALLEVLGRPRTTVE